MGLIGDNEKTYSLCAIFHLPFFCLMIWDWGAVGAYGFGLNDFDAGRREKPDLLPKC